MTSELALKKKVFRLSVLFFSPPSLDKSAI